MHLRTMCDVNVSAMTINIIVLWVVTLVSIEFDGSLPLTTMIIRQHSVWGNFISHVSDYYWCDNSVIMAIVIILWVDSLERMACDRSVYIMAIIIIVLWVDALDRIANDESVYVIAMIIRQHSVWGNCIGHASDYYWFMSSYIIDNSLWCKCICAGNDYSWFMCRCISEHRVWWKYLPWQ